MLIKNVKRDDIDHALNITNEQFGNNIAAQYKWAGRTRQGKDKYSVILRTINSRLAGGRRDKTRNKRRVSTACWHAHGVFLDALPGDAVAMIYSATEGKLVPWSNSENWLDWETGNAYYGKHWMSDLCNCDHDYLVYARDRIMARNRREFRY